MEGIKDNNLPTALFCVQVLERYVGLAKKLNYSSEKD